MKAIILKCSPGTQFHFGKYAPDSDTALNDTSEFIHSDTLFSAIVRTYDDLYSDTNDFVRQFEDANIRISSCFFFLKQGNKQVWFLPKPVSFNLFKTEDHKTYKKITFISKKLWESLSSPAELIINKNIIVLNSKYALLKDELTVRGTTEAQKNISWDRIRLYYAHTQPKVKVHNPSKEDSLYQLSTIEIADNSAYGDHIEVHYYFLYNASDEFLDKFGLKFRNTLSVLAMNGIGAERATIGKLEGVEEVADWAIDRSSSDFYSSLSLLSPIKEEMEALKYYHTILRGGRRTGMGEKVLKSVRMLAEGAILKRDTRGVVLDITPHGFQDGVYKRNGVSLNISIPTTWLPQE